MKLRYWLNNGLKFTAVCVGASIFYSLLMALMEEEVVWTEIIQLAGGYMVTFGVLMSMVFATTFYTQNIPLVISFGATRKEAFWGMQVSRAVSSIVLIGAAFVLLAVSESSVSFRALLTIPLFLGLHLAFHGLGGILAILYAKFQKKGLIIGGIALTVVIIGFMIGFIFAVNNGTIPDFSADISWIVLAAGVLAYIPVSFWEFRTIRTLNVKL